MSTPNRPVKGTPSSLSSRGKQQSILGFFQKSAERKEPTKPKDVPADRMLRTPIPSSDPVEPPSSALPSAMAALPRGRDKENSLGDPDECSSPIKRSRKKVDYAESDDDIDEALRPVDGNGRRRRLAKKAKLSDDSDDEFAFDAATELSAEDIDDFVVADDEDDAPSSGKKKKNRSKPKSPAVPGSDPPDVEMTGDVEDLEVLEGQGSTTDQWIYDPETSATVYVRKQQPQKSSNALQKAKPKAHTTEPEQRYPWLANLKDAERRSPDHPDYDPRTVYIPPMAWAKFSAFEKQYWEIKKNLWDTIVFFKKGKFYELYENDATIAHQLCDLKLTDRVNMRMAGVPESSLDLWSNRLMSLGFKIARVDQMETALGKEMRERDGSEARSKPDKIIRRELAGILTGGTLVDASMLQDDMATYCMAIKEQQVDGRPTYGVSFVDTATARFELTEFADDVDMTKFETLIAQLRPRELLLEKGCISVKALRILKNNTGPTTIWNYLKPTKEFWSADITCQEIDANSYFTNDVGEGKWPPTLLQNKTKELAMSSFGALLQYLQVLKIDRDLLSIGNVSWYDPIRKATSLVLDGQSLINLEIFANSVDGGFEGTLFGLINRCVTPFGKRMLRQWVCHPLADCGRINARLDAVDSLLAEPAIMDQFTASLVKLPDLERLISRVHAKRCKVQDFVRVLDGFEQIEYTMSLLGDVPSGEGIIGQLISSMPDLSEKLEEWKTAFDRAKANTEGVIEPQPGVEQDYDESQGEVNSCLEAFASYLDTVKSELRSKSVTYKDIGKEIYQLEVPVACKVPSNWEQMSATKAVKRYYNPQIRKFVRNLQEAQEKHTKIKKEVNSRFFARFDLDYDSWFAAIKIVSQLDCLISLAKTSSSLGSPACRPVLEDGERTVVEFNELRHPCMINTVSDFIPNDIRLGGSHPNIDLLTGANAAGKSTVLRMTCIAVIMAQVGCYVPAEAARLTPIDRIMSRLGAHDNIFASQSTFFVELSETKKMLTEATPRSLVILDELGRGTSSYDGVAVAQAVLHDIATRVGCVGFFATHYHSIAVEFRDHPEITCKRMAIHVDEKARQVTFLYKLEEGIAEGSFGMHCAHMCGIPDKVVDRATEAAQQWEHTSRLREALEKAMGKSYVPLGILSDLSWMIKDKKDHLPGARELDVLRRAISSL